VTLEDVTIMNLLETNNILKTQSKRSMIIVQLKQQYESLSH